MENNQKNEEIDTKKNIDDHNNVLIEELNSENIIDYNSSVEWADFKKETQKNIYDIYYTIFFIIVIILVLFLLYYLNNSNEKIIETTSFNSCNSKTIVFEPEIILEDTTNIDELISTDSNNSQNSISINKWNNLSWDEIYDYFSKKDMWGKFANYWNYSEVKTFVNKYNSTDTKILVASFYWSSWNDNSINLYINYNEWPAIIFLNSYEAVDWKITWINDNIKALIYISYDIWSTINIDKKIPVFYKDRTYIDYELSPNCYIEPLLHCKNYWYLSLNKFIRNIFWKDMYGFSANTWKIPWKIIDEYYLSTLKKEYEDIINKHKISTVPINKIFWENTDKTWWHYLNQENDIPTWEFKAFYINTNDPKKVIKSENVKNISISDSWNKFYGINSQDFWAYYVWYFNYDKDEIVKIQYDTSWSEMKIYIDWEQINPDNSSWWKDIFYNFKKWKHKIEVEYINNWHTVKYKVIFKQ